MMMPRSGHMLLLIILSCMSLSRVAVANIESQSPLVMLLHGQGRTSISMWKAESFLEEHGLQTDNWNYDGFFSAIDELGNELVQRIDQRRNESPQRPVYFLTHSLGGIVVRYALARMNGMEQARIVMLAPPNQGARMADRFSPWLSWLLRPMAQLTTGPNSFIAGIPALKTPKTLIIKAKDDYLLDNEETLLPEAEGYEEVETGHTSILWNEQALNRAVQYFKN
jgi:hypothetical protein